ncbi:MAG: TetR/AcrR family transcriptional regulator [Actinobacteria bacterium]|nr:TetR/AcrR family transcriptional regulator [Actinomycetota bacterium]NIS29063.1 TetR/AcrR family transcriptional regulator [Actinomycetota bacterium]NIT94313.1 TetR/AcrR family transcriptional regulator [Actinomycetota bacterium]NIU17925.1 TetR/AcrR family transcriptional regulator [Actinomycetota bacterium]NIU64469.1 TetR/AcrR family transcriptional regulator [Actinomycetota bacterium]
MSSTSAIEGTGRRVGLDRDDVVGRALQLVEVEGPAALTMRRLAAELDVTTTTVYWHVGSRDELIEAVIRLHSRRQAAQPLPGDTPHERIMSAVRLVWDNAIEHPALTSLAHQNGLTPVLGHPVEVTLVRELEAAGVHGQAAADGLRSILMTISGFLVAALRDRSAVPESRRAETLWAEVDDPGISPATVTALTADADLPALFEATMRAVVASHLPTEETP